MYDQFSSVVYSAAKKHSGISRTNGACSIKAAADVRILFGSEALTGHAFIREFPVTRGYLFSNFLVYGTLKFI